MPLSVSSFPEAPPKLVQQPKRQPTSSLKNSGRFLGTLLSKRSVGFLKGIRHFAKTYVKGGISRPRANVSRSQSISKHWHHSTLSTSSIRSSNTVIDISPISNTDEYFSAISSDVDTSSLNLTIDISLSPTIGPATPTSADIPAISPTDPVKAPYQSPVQSLVGDGAHAHETIVQHPAKEHEEVASDSEPYDPQPPDSEITAPLTISPSLTTSLTVLPVRSTEGRRHSAPAGVKASATETVPPTRPRYKSETAIGLTRLITMTPSDDPPSSEGKDSSRGVNPIPQPPATGSTHTSESTSMKKQRQQRRVSISKRARARSGTSSKSTGSNKALESPPLSARTMLSTRSAGSRLSANSRRSSPSTAAPPLQPFSSSAAITALVPESSPKQMDHLIQAPPHLRPKTSDVQVRLAASPRSCSPPPSLVVSPGPSDGDTSEKSPALPSSVDKGRWLRLVAVPHAENWGGEQQRRRPLTAPEAVLMASW